MHCVKAFGEVFDMLRAPTTARAAVPVYLHSFGGKAGMLNSLLKMKPAGPTTARATTSGELLYFGFSAAVNLRSPKTRKLLAEIPPARLLLESDLEGPPAAVEAGLAEMLRVVAEVKGWSLEEAARITAENAHRFYALD